MEENHSKNQKSKQQSSNQINSIINNFHQLPHQDQKNNISLKQIYVDQGRHSSNLNSPKIQKEYKMIDNEENYVSVISLNERQDLSDISQYLTRSQQDLFYYTSDRTAVSGIQPLNSTIYPKINLYGKQEENSKFEHFNDEQISVRQSFFQNADNKDVQNRLSISFGANSEVQNENFNNTEKRLSKSKKNNPSFNSDKKNDRRRSSNLQLQQQMLKFEQSLQKIIQDKSNKQIELKDDEVSREVSDLEMSQRLQKKTTLQQSQDSAQNGDLHQNTLNIQKLKKKEEKMRNQFVIRVKHFQRFLKNMKNLSQSFKFRTMSLDQKQKFNDLSFFQSKKKQLTMAIDGQQIISKAFSKVFSKLINFIPVFNPLNSAIIIFELVVIVILVTQMLVLPLADSFDIDFFEIRVCQIIFYTIPAIIFTVAVFIKLNTGFFKENIVVSNRKKILRNYYKTGGLVIDIITIFSIIITQFTQNSYVYIFFLIRLYQIQNSLSKVDTKFSLSQRVPHSFEILKLVFLVLMLAHMNGCIFNYVAKNLDESWITKNNLKNSDWYVRYINSVYFSFITMVTVGYGDITPVSLQEKVFVIFMVVYSCGAFGYIVSSIGNIFTERAQIKAKYKSQLVDIIHYMRTRNIDQAIQSQVFQYLHYLEQMDHYNHQKGEQIVQKLSPYLQSQINMNSYYPFLNKTNIFKLNFKNSILVNSSLKMKELTFGPGQIIFNENDCDNRIFYILKGEVQLSYNNHNICVKDENDNCFGISEFFSGEARSLQAKSKTVSQILYLELNQFIEVLKEDPLEYEKFCCIKEQITESRTVVDQACYFCKQFNHAYDKCPFFTIKNQRQLFIERSKISINQTRQQHYRKKKLKFSSVVENGQVRLHLKAIRLNYINNQVIDKHQMIQLVANTIQMETDFDFYKKYDAFYLKCIDDQEFQTVLVPFDKIFEEFYTEDESCDDEQEVNDNLNPGTNMQKKLSRSSIQGSDNFLEEQKISSQTSIVSSPNQQPKKSLHQITQMVTQNSSNINSNSTVMNDKASIFKDTITTMMSKKTTFPRQQTTKRLSNLSHCQNQNTSRSSQKIQDDNLLKYIINLISQSQAKNGEYQVEMQSQIQGDDFFIIPDFDKMHEFIRFFPKNNYSYVIEQYNKQTVKKQRVIIKRRKRSIKKNTIIQSPGMRKNRSQNRQNTVSNNLQNQSFSSIIVNDQQSISYVQNNNQMLNSVDFSNQASEKQSESKFSYYKQPEMPKSSFFKQQQ
ncbi:cation channel family protein (macronuclear) [Tetrahymena thermophila SB210]|uniref:Cation channel family protein n=1 Tax=Tetrahymena thermophila (strain SB210) TaxID=312017 RepID=I7MFZ5_TETTS|nr:cation channel family protein [Tetrahymena thermophila SB210]EAR84612.2 cation channel family protein [Tetrahymena thermophila SB210]|eukprot:XP_001032275.2 cation channel family protein [Tetrahymena thermophila SB210]